MEGFSIQDIPERIAKLLLLYLTMQLTTVQAKELERWIAECSENEEMFLLATKLAKEGLL